MIKIKEKLKKYYEKCINNIKNNGVIILIFVIIFIFLALQHSVVGMYFDDYGNASLSYGTIIEGVDGTEYSISQLFEWAEYIYNNWGGRILYAICFVIPLLKNGASLYMFVQTFVVFFIIFFMYKIAKYFFYQKKSVFFVPIVIFILYTYFDMTYLRNGIYWASASVLYIWPLLPFFAFIYFYMNVTDNIKSGKKINLFLVIPIMLFLNFFATFSQEQIGIAVIAFEVLFIFFDHIKDVKKYLKIDVINVVFSIVTYLVLFLAPGNWVRMDTNESFANLTLMQKICSNVPTILKYLFNDRMKMYMYIICVLTAYMVFKIIIKNYKHTKKYFFLSIFGVIPLIEIVLMKASTVYYNEILCEIWNGLTIISISIVILLYYYQKKDLRFVSIYGAAMVSIFCLVMSPSIIPRTFLPFIFMMCIIYANVVIDLMKENIKQIKYICIVAIVIMGIHGMNLYIEVYEGYRDNYSIIELNDSILRSYNQEDGKVVTLYKLKNYWFGSEQLYTEPSMAIWLEEYYDLPHDLEFEWVNIYDTSSEE